MDYNIIALSPTKWKALGDQNDVGNTQTVATHSGVARQRHYVTGVTISASGAPAAAVLATLKDGSTIIDEFEIPAAAFATIRVNYNRPLECTTAATVTGTLPALGSSIKGTIVVHGFTVQD